MGGRAAATEAEASLRTLGDPVYWVIGPTTSVQEQRPGALDGVFEIFHEPTPLEPPVAWGEDPGKSRSWHYQLHTLQFLRPLLDPRAGEIVEDGVRRCVDIALDWIESNRIGGGGNPLAWYDMVVGIRATYLAYLTRLAGARGWLEPAEATVLVDALVEHGDHLADPANYTVGHNHGLFQDEGLLLLAHQLAFRREAKRWTNVARRRIRKGIERSFSSADAVHLEHSPAYHFSLTSMLWRLVQRELLVDEDVRSLLERAREAGRWLVLPDGTMPPLADTTRRFAPPWARTDPPPAGARGFYGTGYGVVRDGDSYLLAAAGHHGFGHKHADDGTVLLYEGGRLLLGDGGPYSYDEAEPARVLARASQAHNVLTVDGASFAWQRARPYGSGLLAVASFDGIHALTLTNPFVEAQGVTHRRAIFYEPAAWLVIVDAVEADAEHRYTRHFIFGQDVVAETTGDDAVNLSVEDRTATLRDLSADAGELRLGFGDDAPACGHTSPMFKRLEPVWSMEIANTAATATLVSGLDLAGAGLTCKRAAVAEDHAEAVITAGDRRLELRLSIGDRTLSATDAAGAA